MQATPRRDPDWEYWPGRPTGEERVRSRLRALFVPTEAEDAITELIAEHSRELETRATELRRAVTELEHLRSERAPLDDPYPTLLGEIRRALAG